MQTLKDKLATGRFVVTAEIAPPATCDAADLVTKAAPLKGLADAVNVTDGAGARAHLGPVGGGGDHAAKRHRADPPAHLPRPEPHGPARRADGRGRARHPQPAAAQGRRSQAGRPAGRQAGVRLRHRGADRGSGGDPRQARTADRQEGRRARPTSSSPRPTCRSIRRPAGSRRASRPSSPPAANSCRRSSAWTRRWCAATWRGSPSTA